MQLKYQFAIILSIIQSLLLLYLGLGTESNSFQSTFCLFYSIFFMICAVFFGYIMKIETINKL